MKQFPFPGILHGPRIIIGIGPNGADLFMPAFLNETDYRHIFMVIDTGPVFLNHCMRKGPHAVEKPQIDRFFLKRIKEIPIGKLIGWQKRPELHGFTVFQV
jgi:hypothetical protein